MGCNIGTITISGRGNNEGTGLCTTEKAPGADAEWGEKGRKKEINEQENDKHSATFLLNDSAQLVKMHMSIGTKGSLAKKDIT